MSEMTGIDPSVPPSGTGCVECEAAGGWWVHLRRCAQCGHVGCCDTSPSQHATAHWKATGHPVIQSFEPGEDWFWNFATEEVLEGVAELALPTGHPLDQPVPGPAGRVPRDWRLRVHYPWCFGPAGERVSTSRCRSRRFMSAKSPVPDGHAGNPPERLAQCHLACARL